MSGSSFFAPSGATIATRRPTAMTTCLAEAFLGAATGDGVNVARPHVSRRAQSSCDTISGGWERAAQIDSTATAPA